MQTNEQKFEPIAIVGIGLRFAGDIVSVDSLWRALCNAEINFKNVPEDRWSLALYYDETANISGRSPFKQAGFLNRSLSDFDAPFFGFLPREAEGLDPQQRVLLECSWEAFEDAGIIPDRLAKSRTGVYAGVFTLDSMVNQVGPLSRHLINPNTSTNFSATMISNRLSYFYDLCGPSVSIDTACSSSLVALHYACQDIWSGQTDIGLVAGANIMIRPEYPIAMSKGGFLAADARCKSFDARADGYARGEGGAVVILKPLACAIADGNKIYASIVGTGVNQDGRTVGITVPNHKAQKGLIDEVYARHGLDPLDTVYVEAHGTGTPAGDPIEARAISQSIAKSKKQRKKPLLIGSLKPNIGHTEAAAGIAGLIKAALCLKHGEVPRQANFVTPNREIPFQDLNIKIPVRRTKLPCRGGAAQASVNSFGYGGTNAHAVLLCSPKITEETAQAWEKTQEVLPHADDSGWQITPFSAESIESLNSFAKLCINQLSEYNNDYEIDAFRNALIYRRTHHSHRLAIISKNRGDIIDKLKIFTEKKDNNSDFVEGKIRRLLSYGPVFVFTGMGPQWWGMGRELYASQPIFRKKLDEIDEIFRGLSGWSLLTEMMREQEASRLTENQYAQPANFALQIALSHLLQAWGVCPAAVVGHSVGEVAAAHVAGVLSLEEATLVSFCRSQAQQLMAGRGAMMALGLSSQKAQELIGSYPGQIEIAAVNSPTSCTLSGDPPALDDLARTLDDTVFQRRLKVEIAYHSHHMEGLEARIKDGLATLAPKSATIPLYSTVSAQKMQKGGCDSDYWWKNVRQPVLFSETISNIMEDGHEIFWEIGPHPVLRASINEISANESKKITSLNTLRKDKDEMATLLESLASFYVLGGSIDWPSFTRVNVCPSSFPAYPWDHQRHWLEGEAARLDRLGHDGHILPGRRMPDPMPTWQTDLNTHYMGWLQDHVIANEVLFPGAGFVEAAFGAAREMLKQGDICLEDVKFTSPLVLSRQAGTNLMVRLDDERGTFTVSSKRIQEDSVWRVHAQGRLRFMPISLSNLTFDVESLRRDLKSWTMDRSFFYKLAARRGLTYGPQFQAIQFLQGQDKKVLAKLESTYIVDDYCKNYSVHPTILDASFHMMMAVLDRDSDNKDTFVPVGIKRIIINGNVGQSCWAYGQIRQLSSDSIIADIVIADDNGDAIVKIESFKCQPLDSDASSKQDLIKNLLYKYHWENLEDFISDFSDTDYNSWLNFVDSCGYAEPLVNTLEKNKQSCLRVYPSQTAQCVQGMGKDDLSISVNTEDDFDSLIEVIRARGINSILYAWAADEQVAGLDGSSICTFLINFLKAIRNSGITLRVVVITREAQFVLDQDIPRVNQSAVWNMARVIMNEHPEMGCRSVDLPSVIENPSLAAYAILSDIEEDEIAIRGNCAYIHRLQRIKLNEDNFKTEIFSADHIPYYIEKNDKKYNQWKFLRKSLLISKNDEVVIQVHRIIVNMHRNNIEIYGASGIKETKQYKNSENYKINDILIPVTNDIFVASHLKISESCLLSVPCVGKDLNDEFAMASQSLLFAKAMMALENVKLENDRRFICVLLQGNLWELSAVRLAVSKGWDVVVLHQEQLPDWFLSQCADCFCFDGRDITCRDKILQITDTQGVDIILGSSGSALFETACESLSPSGQIIAVQDGRHLVSATLQDHLAAKGSGITYFDFEHRLERQKETVKDKIKQIWALFEAGHLIPLALPEQSIEDKQDQWENEGREDKFPVQIKTRAGKLTLPPSRELAPIFHQDGTYIVTGGFGGFGSECAKWMAAQGAGAICLIGRKGANTPEAKNLIRKIQQTGCTVFGEACDISDHEAVRQTLETIRETSPYPIKGIIHAAAVVDDQFLLSTTTQSFNKVMGPKARGALYLHALTCDDPIDLFINFSSISAIVGQVGQCSYVAANGVLDALAVHRRAMGQSGLSINWGAIDGVGMVADDENLRKHLFKLGIRTVDYRQGLSLIPHLVSMDYVNVGVMDVDWDANLGLRLSPRYSYLASQNNQECTEQAQNLQQLPENERLPALLEILLDEISKTLSIPADAIPLDIPLTEAGIDSLAATEIQSAISAVFGVNLSQIEITTSDNIGQVCHIILDRLSLNS